MAQGKNPVNLLQGLPDGGRGGKGAEIEGAVALHLAHHLQGGKLLAGVEAEGDVGLVVPQVDVVAGAVLFDQGVFEDERFLLGVGDDRLDLANPVHQEADVGTAVPAGDEVGAQPLAQVLGLAHVEDGLPLPFHQVDPGGGGEFFRVELLQGGSLNEKSQGGPWLGECCLKFFRW